MADIVVEYDRVDTNKLAQCVLDLERRGYHIWLDLPDSKGSVVTREALKKRFETQAGLYAIYSEEPIGLDDLHAAIQQFGTSDGKGKRDGHAATLFACLKGVPDFPASFRRIRGKDMENPAEGLSMRKDQPGAVVSVPAGGPRPGLIIEKIMGQQHGSTLSGAPAFQIRLAPGDIERRGPASLSSDGFAPAYSQPEPVFSTSVPARRTTIPDPKATEAASRLSMVHNLAGIALVVTAATFLAAIFIFADSNRSHLSVIAIAAVCALLPFIAYRLLRNYEHRLRAEERSKREIFRSPIMV